MNFPGVLLFIFSLFLMTACASNIAEYPSDWPDTITAENKKCIKLTGYFLNKGVGASTNYSGRNVYLSELLVPFIPDRQYVENAWVDSVELRGGNDGKLKIVFREKGKQIFKTILNESHDFTCTSQYLILSDRSSPENMMGITERFEKTKFYKGVDGSVIVSDKQTDIGLVILFPYRESMVQRYRFLPVDISQ